MSIAKLIHADNFFRPEAIASLVSISRGLTFVDKEYGKEVENFNLVFPDLDDMFSKLVGESVTVDDDRSGVFRRPDNCLIHFEGFDSTDEWCFIVALENTTFNLYHHLSGAESALDGYHFNYRNLFEWDYDVNILLKPNQGVIFRPWLFHSVENGLVQYYRLVGKK